MHLVSVGALKLIELKSDKKFCLATISSPRTQSWNTKDMVWGSTTNVVNRRSAVAHSQVKDNHNQGFVEFDSVVPGDTNEDDGVPNEG